MKIYPFVVLRYVSCSYYLLHETELWHKVKEEVGKGRLCLTIRKLVLCIHDLFNLTIDSITQELVHPHLIRHIPQYGIFTGNLQRHPYHKHLSKYKLFFFFRKIYKIYGIKWMGGDGPNNESKVQNFQTKK